MTYAELRTRSVYSSLNNSEKKVATYFLNNTENFFHFSIAQLAEESGVSQVAWVRFCKSIGFNGLKDLRKNMFDELGAPSSENGQGVKRLFTDLSDQATLAQMAQTVKHSAVQAIEDTFRLLDLEAVENAADKMINAESISLFGVGASALVAEDLFEKLLRIGKNVRFCRDLHIQLTCAANLSKRDTAVFFSNSGTTCEILESLNLARQGNCTTIAVTKLCKNPLASAADIALSTSSPEVYLRSGAMSSRIAQLVVVDVLYTAIASRDYTHVESQLERSFESVQQHKVKR